MGLVAIGKRLYAAGGYGPAGGEIRALEIYTPKRDRWRSGPPMPTGRNHVAAAALEGEMIVTGGRPGPEPGGTAVVEAYDPQRKRWRVLAPLETARSGHAAAVAGGALVVFGGEQIVPGGATIGEVERFDAAGNAWRPLPAMITPRHGLGGVARRQRLYAVEGGPRPGLAYSSALEFLDLR
jgi:N-acetylneuraminic acid mutarotase